MRKTGKIVVVYVTFPSLKIAKQIIEQLITAKLVACGNIFRVSSIYVWKGKIEKAAEYGAFIKTVSSNYQKVEKYIKKNHPYEIPEIIGWPIERGYNPYLDWVISSTF